MERSEVKRVLLEIAKREYDMDLSEVDEQAPLADLQNLNPKFDSMSAIELIFDVEDELGIKTNDNDMSQPANLAEIIDSLTQAVNKK